MAEDLSTGMKIGIILIILLAVIAVVISIMAIVKNITNSATNDLTNSVQKMQSLKMDSYNQKQITGNEVLGFITLYHDQGYSVLISTAKARRNANITNKSVDYIRNYGALLDCFKSTNNYVWNGTFTSVYNESGVRVISDEDDYLTKLFYDSRENCYISRFTMNNSAEHKYNMKETGIYNKTSDEYVNPDHKFTAYLVKDISGTILGVYFVEDAYLDAKKEE